MVSTLNRLVAYTLALFTVSLCAASESTPTKKFTDKDRQYWALQPVRRVSAPVIKQSAWVRNPIDAFILQKLEEKGITPGPPADKVTLIRRVTFDLTGLPPTPEEVEAFLADDSPTPMKRSSTGCWRRHIMASAGRGIGWTWRATRKATAFAPTRIAPMSGAIATM